MRMTALACVLLLRRWEVSCHPRPATAIEGSEHNPETKGCDSAQGAPNTGTREEGRVYPPRTLTPSWKEQNATRYQYLESNLTPKTRPKPLHPQPPPDPNQTPEKKETVHQRDRRK